MNLKAISIASFAALLIAAPVRSQQKIDPGQLPAPVRDRLDAAGVQPSTIKNVTRHVDDSGGPFYDIELEKQNAMNSRIRISEGGGLITDTRATDPSEGNREVKRDNFSRPDMPVDPSTTVTVGREDLPEPVRRTVEQHAAGREIASVDFDNLAGQRAYTIRFKDEGRNPWIYVAADGTLLKPTGTTPLPGAGITFADTPVAVQETLRREVGDGHIETIEREDAEGQPVYRVEIQEAGGSSRQVRISDNGQVFETTRGAPRPAKDR